MSDIDTAFQEFHHANPHVYEYLVQTARRFVAKGARRLSIKCLYEFARMEHWLNTETQDPWRLSNNHTASYSRLIMAQEADLAGLFQTKKLRDEPKSVLEDFGDWLLAG